MWRYSAHGGGVWQGRPRDGIFMASSVDASCCFWDCEVDTEIIGHLGDIEHLRKYLDSTTKKVSMNANNLYWITDRTPHESLPIKESGYRQFFRIISSKLSVW